MTNLKKENGVTLLALLITLVVMAIIVAIPLRMALSDDGVIKKAQEARNAEESEEKLWQGEIDKLKERKEAETGEGVIGDYVEFNVKEKLNISNITKDGFVVNVTVLSGRIKKIEYKLEYSNREEYSKYQTDKVDDRAKSFKFKNLTPDTDYVVLVRVTSEDDEVIIRKQEVTTKSE